MSNSGYLVVGLNCYQMHRAVTFLEFAFGPSELPSLRQQAWKRNSTHVGHFPCQETTFLPQVSWWTERMGFKPEEREILCQQLGETLNRKLHELKIARRDLDIQPIGGS